MENKYYTPHIDEFTSDFHYEYFNGKVWVKSDDFTNDWDYEDNPHYAVMKGIDNGIIRVKYLDSNDIEELGFIPEPYFKDVDYFGYKKGNIRLYLLENDRIEITTEDKKFESYYFLGVIKNKSELKKVLNMLNIK